MKAIFTQPQSPLCQITLVPKNNNQPELFYSIFFQFLLVARWVPDKANTRRIEEKKS